MGLESAYLLPGAGILCSSRPKPDAQTVVATPDRSVMHRWTPVSRLVSRPAIHGCHNRPLVHHLFELAFFATLLVTLFLISLWTCSAWLKALG